MFGFSINVLQKEVLEIILLYPKNSSSYGSCYISITYENVYLDAFRIENNKDDNKK